MIEVEHIGLKVLWILQDMYFVVFSNMLSLTEGEKDPKKCSYFTMWKIERYCAYRTYGTKAAKAPLDELIWPPR